MSQHHYKSPEVKNQLTLPGLAPWLIPGYPIRGLMRCLALCIIHGWPFLGALAEMQFDRWERGRQ